MRIELFKENYIKASIKTGCFKKAKIEIYKNAIVLLLTDDFNKVYSVQKANAKNRSIRTFKSLDAAFNLASKSGFSDVIVTNVDSELSYE